MSSIRHLLDLKKETLFTIQPEATLKDALRIMTQKCIGSLLVMENDRLVGIINERDFIRKVSVKGRDIRGSHVRDIMTSKVITAHPEQTVNECMELMERNNLSHLPVVINDKVIGVISRRDLMRDIIYQHKKKMAKLDGILIDGK